MNIKYIQQKEYRDDYPQFKKKVQRLVRQSAEDML